MSRRAFLAVSGVVTAFVLVMGGAVASYAQRPARAPTASNAVPVEEVQAREAEYRRRLDEANAKLRAQEQAGADQPANPPAARAPQPRSEHRGEREEHEARNARYELRHYEHDEDDDG